MDPSNASLSGVTLLWRSTSRGVCLTSSSRSSFCSPLLLAHTIRSATVFSNKELSSLSPMLCSRCHLSTLHLSVCQADPTHYTIHTPTTPPQPEGRPGCACAVTSCPPQAWFVRCISSLWWFTVIAFWSQVGSKSESLFSCDSYSLTLWLALYLTICFPRHSAVAVTESVSTRVCGCCQLCSLQADVIFQGHTRL